MASQLGDYFDIDFHWRGSNNVDMIINPARTQQFLSGTTNLSVLLQYIKDTFYLDDVVGFQANKDGTNYHGFWGTCIVGGLNESMHRSDRIVEIHADSLAQSKRMFNDAGLNTKGFVKAPVVTNNRIGQLAGYIPTKSAYFVDSDMIKWQYSVNGEAWTTPADLVGLSQRLEQNIPFGQTDLFKADDMVYFRGQVVNAEGTFIGTQSIQIQMRVRLVVLSSNSFPSSAYTDWNNGERINYYTDSLPLNFWVGSRLFQNDAPTLNDAVDASAGGYSDGVNWYLVTFVAERDRNEITEAGVTTSTSGYPDNWPTNDPAYDRLISNTLQGTYYEGNDKDDACTNGQSQSRPQQVWLRTTFKGNLTYYRDQAGLTTLTGYFNNNGQVFQYVGGARVGNAYICTN